MALKPVFLSAVLLVMTAAAGQPAGTIGFNDTLRARASGGEWCGDTARIVVTAANSGDLDRNNAQVQHFLTSLGARVADECPQASVMAFTAEANGVVVWRDQALASEGWKISAAKASDAQLAARRAVPPALIKALSGQWSGTYCGGQGQTEYAFNLSPSEGVVTEQYCRAVCGRVTYRLETIAGQPRQFKLVGADYNIVFSLSKDGRKLSGKYAGHQLCLDVELERAF